MDETGMVPASGTQAHASGPQKPVEFCCRGGEPVVTGPTSRQGQVYAVRVTKGEERVLLQIDTGRLVERSRIKAANDSIRHRNRG